MRWLTSLPATVALFGAGLMLGASPSRADSFTGPTSPYYLDNITNQSIYVVQGTNVINSFPWANGSGCNSSFCEGNLAVTSVVSTNWFGSGYPSSATGGQYTLSGIPTGTTWTGTPPPAGESYNYIFDGTSDGTRNYTIENLNSNYTGIGIDFNVNVIATDLNWQNPVVLFSIPGSLKDSTVPQKLYAGVTYDPTNNSLWISGIGDWDVIADYSLTGTLLSSFSTGIRGRYALAFDPADATLWFNNSNLLYQYSTSGVLLQSGTPSGLPDADFLAGEFAEAPAVPIPAALPLCDGMDGWA